MSAPRHRILIVDDEESTRLLIARLLSRTLKVEPQLAGTCEQALRLARNYAYDAILLDLLMPGVGGLELLRQVRRSSANMATPVLVVSVLDDRETRERCRDAGADAHLSKPVEERKLAAAVRKLLAGRGKTRIP
jgi:DNA-binding response OmpR family regulator